MPPPLDSPTQPAEQSPSLPPIAWPLAALQRAVQPDLPDFRCEVLPVVDSSNSELMRRFKAGQHAPTLMVAEQQTAGRGRLGRSWHSAHGQSLTFSLGMLLSPAAWSGLSLAVGVSLAESLDEDGGAGNAVNKEGALRIGLKWPNDLWLIGPQGTEEKLAGVLIETAAWEGLRYAVIGVGINIGAVTLPADSPGADRVGAAPIDAAAALAAVPPGHLQQLRPAASAEDALLRVVPPLVQAVQAFSQFGFAPFQARFAQRDVLAGREVSLSDGEPGQACGVTIDGALQVKTAGGMVIVASAEVSVRPVAPPRRAARQAKALPPC